MRFVTVLHDKFTKSRLDRKIIFLNAALILFLSVAISAVIISIAGEIIIRDRQSLVQQNINVTKTFIENELNTILNTGLGIAMNNAVQKYYEGEKSGDELLEDIRNIIQTTMDGNQSIQLIALYDETNQTNIYSKSARARYKAEELVQEHYEGAVQTNSYHTRIWASDMLSTSGQNSITIYFPVYSTNRLDSQYGILAISFQFEIPSRSVMSEDELDFELFLLDSQGRYFLSDQIETGEQSEILEKFPLGSNSLVEKGTMYVVSPLNKWNLSLVGKVEVGDLKLAYLRMMLLAVVLVVLLMMVSIWAEQHMMKRLYMPMDELLTAMDQIDSESMNYRLAVEKNAGEDQRKLREGFNSMIERLQEAMETIQSKQTMIEKLRFAALQSQIQPHFLYNTLESIHWQALAGGNRDLSKMVKALAQFYRIVLSNGDDMITLAQEIEHVKSYVTIQNLRYDNIIDLQIHVSKEYLQYELPKVTLQPLVENAIYHGIRGREGNHGEIRIYDRVLEDRLEIIVSNNGENISKEQMQYINGLLVDAKISEGYGINNVNKRFQIEFGVQYGLRYEQKYDEGIREVLAIVSLPLQKI